MDYGREYPPQRGKTRISRGNEKVYVETNVKGRVVGEMRIARGWNALGRKVSLVIKYKWYMT